MTLIFIAILLVSILAGLFDYFLVSAGSADQSLIKSGVIGFIVFGLGILICGITFYGSMSDFDILNGQITGKKQVWVPCTHTYQCNCTEDSKGNTTCQTCYYHTNDWDWDVYSTVGTFTIDRVDWQGADEPKRWADVKIGEPASRKEFIMNYMKASKQSLYSDKITPEDYAKFKSLLPVYPKPYDYYRYNRVLPVGMSYPESNQLSEQLSMDLRKVGNQKQVNILVVVVPTNDKTYRYALEKYWQGGKKNDAVIVIGSKTYPKIDWTSGFSYANSMDNAMLFDQLSDDLMKSGSLKDTQALSRIIINDVNRYWNRHPMKGFKYLSHDYVPSGKTLFLAILAYLLAIVLTIFGVNYAEENM